MEKKISFKLFGGISISSDDQHWISLNDFAEKGIGKKQQAFLTYLLLNSKHRVSSSELIEQFWASSGKDPMNSLKNMMHKIRTLLHAAYSEIEDLIITQPGGYEWNPNVSLELDVDVFEQLYRRTKSIEPTGCLKMQMEAFYLYDGDILPGVHLEWLDRINTYYRSVYIDICKSLAIPLLESERWDDVIYICKRAYALAPEIEEFTVCSMHALIATGLPKQAMKQYDNYRAMLWSEYNLVPSDRVEQMYSLAVEKGKSAEDFEKKVMQQLMQLPDETGAFQCGLLVFQNIMRLERRHMVRSGTPACIAVLRTETAGKTEPTITDIRRLERTLQSSLRAGDPFTRLNQGSFALLLAGATTDNAQNVVERIQHNFYKTYPRSKAILLHHIYSLATEQEP